MGMRSSSLANNPLAVTRELDGRYDVVLQVRDNLTLIEQVAGVDFAAIINELEAAQDFTGISVVQGTTVAWDGVGKILTVPKGDKGDTGSQGVQGIQGGVGDRGLQGLKGDTGLKGDAGMQGPRGFTGDTGIQGSKGDTGDDLTISQITYNGNGTFNWLFSDGTVYVTPSLKGPKGDIGEQGVKGEQGIGVHHLKGTNTTHNEGDFGVAGETDTYTFYSDANENVPLGWFKITNGVSFESIYDLGLMLKSIYDTNNNGIVDNAEKVNNLTVETAVPIGALFTDTVYNHPSSGVTAGTYKSVTVDSNGHVTAGTNPTSVSEYGLTDVYTKTEVNASLAPKVNSSDKGVANGIATLDTNGKVVLTQIPDSILGQLEYMGTWDFSTIPTATQKGQYWIASVSGNGYIVGDWAVWNGSTFDKVDNTDAVASVAGRTGNVVLTKSDVGLSSVDNTADNVKNVLSATKWTTGRTIGITGDITYTSGSLDGTANVTGTATLANSGVTIGTYKSVTVDAKGRVTGGTNPTTLLGYGISDTYTKTEVDSLIGAINSALDTINGVVI